MKLIKYPALLLLFLLLLVISACSTIDSPRSSPPLSSPTTEAQKISQPDSENKNTTVIIGAQAAKNEKELSLEKMLAYAIQDEYLAHAEYEFIISRLGEQRPFSNIIKAEETHIKLLTPLFAKYTVSLPGDTAKEYIPHPAALEDALKAGVQAEIDNIAMYDSFLQQTLPEDVKLVFVELRDASKNHLASFQRQLKRA